MDNQTLKKGQELYGFYMDLSRDDFDTREEYLQERKDIADELKELLGIDNIYDAQEILYSKNQLQFIDDATSNGHKIHFGYSGRGMYGDVCPAVYLDSYEEFNTIAKHQLDSMGLGVVKYARS